METKPSSGRRFLAAAARRAFARKCCNDLSKKNAEAPTRWIGLGKQILGQHDHEKFLHQVLGVLVVKAGSANKTVNGFPISPDQKVKNRSSLLARTLAQSHQLAPQSDRKGTLGLTRPGVRVSASCRRRSHGTWRISCDLWRIVAVSVEGLLTFNCSAKWSRGLDMIRLAGGQPDLVCRDQRALCFASLAFGRPCPPLDHARSASQKAPSSRAALANPPQKRRASVWSLASSLRLRGFTYFVAPAPPSAGTPPTPDRSKRIHLRVSTRTHHFGIFNMTRRSRADAVRVNRSFIVGRRAARQSLARPVTLLRSKLTRRPAPGELPLGFCARRSFHGREKGRVLRLPHAIWCR